MQQDDIDKAIENLEKCYKDGNIQGIEVNSQYLDVKLKDQQNRLNTIVIANLNKSNELLAGLQQEIQKSAKSINDSNQALADQQGGQNRSMVRFTAIMAVTSILSLVAAGFSGYAAWLSAKTANLSANQAANTAMAQLRPYVVLEPETNGVLFKNKNTLVFKIYLKNIGQTPALKILKGYSSSLQVEGGNGIPGQSFREKLGEEDALAPTQTSAEQPLDIYIKGFDLNKKMSIKVEVLITYEGFHEIDSERYLSKAIYVITPITPFDFIVSQPKLFFGLAKDGW